MNKRFLLVFLSVFVILSCSQYINLGSSDEDGEIDMAGEYNESDSVDSAPWDDEVDTENCDADGIYDSGDNSDWGDTADSAGDWGDAGDTYYDDDKVENNDNDPDSGRDDGADSDNWGPGDDWNDPGDDWNDPGENPDIDTGEGSGGYVFPEENPFPEGFSNEECDCGETPDYQPICCDGVTLVFNACYANCYAVKSAGRICLSYENGLCFDKTGDENPDDNENPPENPNECGCFPEEQPEIFGCGEKFHAITFCLAKCHCVLI